MNAPSIAKPAVATWSARASLLAAAAAVYLIGLWPSWWLRDIVLRAAGFPAYAGLWKFLPHLLLYSTLTALAAGVAWIAFARAGVIDGPPLGKGNRPLGKLLIVGFGVIPLVLGVLMATGQGSMIRWIDPDPWSIAGNVFSNFYEEFIFRGFLLSALAAVIGFLPAAAVTSALWAVTHTQYPLSLQVTIFGVGFVLAWLAQSARTIWAPYGAHMIMDVVLDSLVG
ncbi:MAG TPA: CPBP family intramembrane glutamic endopeptidase [Rudaea sp.]|nr:CPBP family intramembrane glutamic endopeptidase [Rudaea sp.]